SMGTPDSRTEDDYRPRWSNDSGASSRAHSGNATLTPYPRLDAYESKKAHLRHNSITRYPACQQPSRAGAGTGPRNPRSGRRIQTGDRARGLYARGIALSRSTHYLAGDAPGFNRRHVRWY